MQLELVGEASERLFCSTRSSSSCKFLSLVVATICFNGLSLLVFDCLTVLATGFKPVKRISAEVFGIKKLCGTGLSSEQSAFAVLMDRLRLSKYYLNGRSSLT